MTERYVCRFASLAPALTPAELNLYGQDKGVWDDTLDCLFYELDATLVEPKQYAVPPNNDPPPQKKTRPVFPSLFEEAA